MYLMYHLEKNIPNGVRMDVIQLRAARAMLGLSQTELSRKTEISLETINKIESGVNQNPRKNTVNALKRFFMNEGLEFIPNSGVRLKNNHYREIVGKDCFIKLLDDVFYDLLAGEELLIACADDRQSSREVNNSYRRIRDKGIRMRQLIEEGNTFLLGSLDEYRYLPTDYFLNSVVLVYGSKVGSVIANENKVLIIDDNGLAGSVRNLFNVIWLGSKKPLESTSNETF